jgi:predicted MPP superfamily phosphohydrolase
MGDWKRLYPGTAAAEAVRRRSAYSFDVVVCTTFLLLLWKIKMFVVFLRTFTGILFLIACIALLLYACIEPVLLEYSFNEIRVPKSFAPFVAVHLTDLHFQWPYPYITEAGLMAVVERVNAIGPDFIFVTGDLVSRYRTASISNYNAAAVGRVLAALRAKRGIYAVLGNNDFCALPQILQALESSGIKLLRNESVQIADDIVLSGIDSVKSVNSAERAIRALRLSSRGLRILLAHEPDVAEAAADHFDLQLSGHTHGGQVIVPFGVGPLILPTLGKKFPVGLYQEKGLLVYVSKGIGISPLPKPLVRFNCRPEVSVLRIVPEI